MDPRMKSRHPRPVRLPAHPFEGHCGGLPVGTSTADVLTNAPRMSMRIATREALRKNTAESATRGKASAAQPCPAPAPVPPAGIWSFRLPPVERGIEALYSRPAIPPMPPGVWRGCPRGDA